MTLWLIRAGRHGEHEQRFLEDDRVFLTWELEQDLGTLPSRDDLKAILREKQPKASEGKITNHAGQIRGFTHGVQPGDWFVLPSKLSSTIHIGEITGPYTFEADAPPLYWHWRSCKWLVRDIPRSRFDQDLLYSFGAFMTVCKIKRNDAEKRVRAMAGNEWHGVPTTTTLGTDTDSDTPTEDDAERLGFVDLERQARDQIAKLITARFKGHGMERLVEAILISQGYVTYASPKGADKGIDILAGTGPMGFRQPQICVQVKSGDVSLDRATLDQLIGTMQNVGASHGLLVSWGGFKVSIDKERAQQFFRVRLWDQDDLIDQVLGHYQELDDEIRAELPLKRVWAVALPEEGEE